MFERLMERAQRSCERRVEAKVLELSEQAKAALPRGIAVEAARDGVRLSGRGLVRRFALESALRWWPLRQAQDRRVG